MAQNELREAIASQLDFIDRMLADQGMPIPLRTMHAAGEFVRLCVSRVSTDGSEEGQPPGSFADYATSRWFRVIYREVEAWYRDRYGSVLEDHEGLVLKAVVAIAGTPFLLRVPMTTTEPGEPGVSFWLCYHDAVRDYEDPLDWIERGPNLSALGAKDVAKARGEATQLASRLRAIHILMMGMKSKDPKVAEVRSGIMPCLERAAEALARGTPESIKAGHWDMQMACELALKCLAQDRAGAFAESHDLFVLYDRVASDAPPFPRSELKKMPNWRRMLDLRYGGGPPVLLRDALRTYGATLTIVEGALNGLEKAYRLGRAKFHLQRPPWIADEDGPGEPKESPGITEDRQT
jgi:hypothetical protein